MDLDLVSALEKKVGRLLERKELLDAEIRDLRKENQGLAGEREKFRAELDRILLKLETLDREGP